MSTRVYALRHSEAILTLLEIVFTPDKHY